MQVVAVQEVTATHLRELEVLVVLEVAVLVGIVEAPVRQVEQLTPAVVEVEEALVAVPQVLEVPV